MVGRVPLVLLCLLAGGNALGSMAICQTVPLALVNASLEDYPELSHPALVLTGREVHELRPAVLPALKQIEVATLLQQIVDEGHGVVFLPALGEDARVLSPRHTFSRFLIGKGFSAPRSNHWLVLGADCDYFTLYHEKVHLDDIPNQAATGRGLTTLIEATYLSPSYQTLAVKRISHFLSEQRAETREREERRRRGAVLLIGRIELLRKEAALVSTTLNVYRETSDALYTGTLAVMRENSLPGDFSLSELLPDHF